MFDEITYYKALAKAREKEMSGRERTLLFMRTQQQSVQQEVVLPDPPSNVSAEAGDEQVVISWSPVSGASNNKLWDVSASGAYTLRATLGGSVSTYTVTGLTNGTNYRFALSTVKSGLESRKGSTVSVVPATGGGTAPTGNVFYATTDTAAVQKYSSKAINMRTAFKNANDKMSPAIANFGNGVTPAVGSFSSGAWPSNITKYGNAGKGRNCLYQMRTRKRYANAAQILLILTQDPLWVRICYESTRAVLDNGFETDWGKWPENMPFPPSEKDSEGKEIGWVHATTQEVADGKKYYSARSRQYWSKRMVGTKRINYYLNGAYYGCAHHALDYFLAHGWLFRCGYILDVNKNNTAFTSAERERFSDVADELWDFYHNHWKKFTNNLWPRHSTKKFFKSDSSLYHTVATQAGIHAVGELWEKLRLGAATSDTVTARKYMIGPVIHNISLGDNNPDYTGVANPTNYKLAFGNHTNQYFTASKNNSASAQIEGGGCDTTYDSEFSGELMLLYLMKVQGENSNEVVKKEHIAALANSYAMVVYPPNKSGKFDYSFSQNTCAAGGKPASGATRYTRMNDGKFYATTPTGGARGTYANGAYGDFAYGGVGGWYMWADPTTEKYDMKQWLTRMTYHEKTAMRMTVGYVQSSSVLNKTQLPYDWVAPLLMCHFLNRNLFDNLPAVPNLTL